MSLRNSRSFGSNVSCTWLIKYEKNKDNTNEHTKLHGENPMRQQPHAKNYWEISKYSSERNGFPWGKNVIKIQYEKWTTRKCSASLAIREPQIKTTLIFKFTPVRMTLIRNTNEKNAGVEVRERTFIEWLWDCKLVDLCWKSFLGFLQETRTRIIIWPRYTTPGHIP